MCDIADQRVPDICEDYILDVYKCFHLLSRFKDNVPNIYKCLIFGQYFPLIKSLMFIGASLLLNICSDNVLNVYICPSFAQ